MTGGINVGQIAAPSPNVAGGLWRAAAGTTLPIDTTTTLANTFTSLGYVDEDGVTISIDRPNTPAFAWGGQKVATLQQHYNVTFRFKLMQILDPDVLMAVHGDSNVTVTAATQSAGTIVTTALNPKLNTNSVWVIEGNYQAATTRLAIPLARITLTADMQLTHKTLAVYNATLEAFPDSSGNFGYWIWDDGVVAVS